MADAPGLRVERVQPGEIADDVVVREHEMLDDFADRPFVRQRARRQHGLVQSRHLLEEGEPLALDTGKSIDRPGAYCL